MNRPIKKAPVTEQEVAATGLRAAVKLVATAENCTESAVFTKLANFLRCNLHQLKHYAKHDGIPAHYIEPTLKFLHMRSIPFGRHQLKPTKAVMAMYEEDA